jgi:Cu(I)/Ag(I) efflux system membrane protein CusA/SilA
MFRAGGVPVRLGDVANIQVGPEMRRGVTVLNGQGEVAGGVVIAPVEIGTCPRL